MADDQAKLQAKVQQLQQLANQLQQLSQQRAQLEAIRQESTMALESLQGLGDDATVYRNIGSLLVQDEKPAAVTRLQDDLETMEVRVKRAKEQEKQYREALDKLQKELQAAFAKARPEE